jgi:hypothetical protein
MKIFNTGETPARSGALALRQIKARQARHTQSPASNGAAAWTEQQ